MSQHLLAPPSTLSFSHFLDLNTPSLSSISSVVSSSALNACMAYSISMCVVSF